MRNKMYWDNDSDDLLIRLINNDVIYFCLDANEWVNCEPSIIEDENEVIYIGDL